MFRLQKILACFFSSLILLFSIQLYVEATPEYQLVKGSGSGYELHACNFNLLASASQKQESDRSSKEPVSSAKYSLGQKIKAGTDYVLKNIFSGLLYYQYSGMIIPSVRTTVIIFPFHFFG